MVAAAPSGWARWLRTLLTRPPVVARLVLWVTWTDWRDPVSRTWLETLPNRNAELMIAKLHIITAAVVAQARGRAPPSCPSARALGRSGSVSRRATAHADVPAIPRHARGRDAKPGMNCPSWFCRSWATGRHVAVGQIAHWPGAMSKV